MKNFIIQCRYAIVMLLMLTFQGIAASAATPWTVNPSDYRYDMSLYLDVSFASSEMDYSQYDFAAFVGDECRGVAEVLPLSNGKSCLYLRARSNQTSGEKLTFKYHKKATGEIRDVENVSVDFQADQQVGYPSSPHHVQIIIYHSVNITATEGGQVSDAGGRKVEGTSLEVTATPDEGYHFQQWSDGNTDNPRTILVEGDMTLEAQFAVNSYKLSYSVDGAAYKEVDVPYGTAITPEVAPVKEGYTFSGWQNLPETMPAHDVQATGTFSINSYKATFKVGEEVIAEKTIVYGEVVTAPEAPAKEGHTFAGWKDVPQTMPAHDVTIEGSYTVNSYKLSYSVDGAAYKEVDVPYGTTITPEAAPVKEGYTFSGWQNLPETMPAHDVQATGAFSINSYKATFKVGEEVIAEKTIVYGEAVTAPEAPAKEGHTFAGWKDVPQTMPAHDLVIEGSYTVNSYKLSYSVDGAAYKEVDVPYGTTITPEAAPVKEGYTFSGWQNLPETMPAHDVQATGTFSINSYKATFKVGEEVIAEKTIVYGEVVTAPEAPAKEGHTFAGWKDVPQTMPAHDVTIEGSYTVNSYKLSYSVDGAAYKEVDVPYGTTITPEAAPVKEGYTFSGWQNLPETMPAHDVQATGTFSINSYKATFKVGEEVIAEKTIVYGEVVTAPEAPAKEGHTFAGWKDVPQTMPAHDLVIEGSYTVNSYKLSYSVDGAAYKEVDVPYGTTITPEAAPVKEGYTFSGWQNLPETMPAHDVQATGTFSINSYKATFKVGEEVIAEKTIVYGEVVTAPEAPAKEGHTFAGWKDVPQTMPAHDVTVEGSYTVNSYKLSYSVDGAAYKEVDVPYGTAITPEAAPVKEGYTFSGWQNLPETMPAHDVQATGAFSINSYKATFKVGEEVIAEKTIVYGEVVTAPEAPAKEGHTFAGWKDVPQTMPAHDVTIEGSYTVNSYRLLVYVDEEVYMDNMVEFDEVIEIPTPELPEGREFKGWDMEIPTTMPAHDLTIHGTTAVLEGLALVFAKDQKLTVYDLNGHLLLKDTTLEKAVRTLKTGCYIINGKKMMLK